MLAERGYRGRDKESPLWRPPYHLGHHCRCAEFLGPLVGVLDGDIIEVLHNNHPEHIRLNGIDCPEKVQAYRKHARRADHE